MKHTPGFLELVAKAKKEILETDADEIQKKLKNNDSFILIDVREESEWAKGHLPKALHLSKGIIERDIETKIPDKNTPLVLYCGGGFRSALSAKNLKDMGYKNVWSMDGGWREWVEKNYPIEN